MENLENKYSELEQFFQDKLGKSVPTEDSWNVPPSSVLDNALKIVNGKKRKKRKRYLFFLLLFVSTLLLFLVIRNSISLLGIQQKINHITEELYNKNINDQKSVQSLKNKKNDLPKDKLTKQKPSNKSLTDQADSKILLNREGSEFEVDNTLENDQLYNNNKPKPDLNNIEQATETLNKSKLKKIGIDINKIEQATEISNKNNPKKIGSSTLNSSKFETKATENVPLSFDIPKQSPQKTSIPKPSKIVQLINKRLDLSSISLLPLMDKKLEKTNHHKLSSYPKFILPINLKDTSKVKFWTGYVFFGANYSKQRMTNLPLNPDFTLKEYDKCYVGFENGLGLKYQFAQRFNFIFAISFSKVNNKSIYQDKLTYKPENEIQNADGTLIYKSDYAVQTTFGGYNNSYDFAIEDDNKVGQMDNITHIKQSCLNVRTSLALEYNLVSKNKFTVKVGAGGGFNYLTSATEFLQTNILNGDSSLFKTANTLAATEDVNRLLLFALSVASVNYQISPKISLGLRTEYSIDLNSLRKTYNANEPKTFGESFNTFIVAAYRF